MSVFGGEMQNCTSATLAFSTRVGPPAALLDFESRIKPGTISVSSMVPPDLRKILMSRRSTISGRSLSMIFKTESTAMGASTLLYCATTFDPSDVVAALISAPRSSMSRGMLMSCRISHALSHARPMASEMTVGCTPRSSRPMHLFSNDPHSTVTLVVPSPAAMSWDLESSTSIFAAGCDTSILFKMVAPSLVMVTSLFALTNILSIPRGPRDVRMASASFFAAFMLLMRMSCFSLLSEYRSPALEALSAGAETAVAILRLSEPQRRARRRRSASAPRAGKQKDRSARSGCLPRSRRRET